MRAPADHLATLVAGGGTDAFAPEPLDGGGELVRGGAAVRDAAGRVVGVVLASDYLSGEAAKHARRNHRGVRESQSAPGAAPAD